MLTASSDPSTVQELRPNHSVELAYIRSKNSLRYHGSHLMNLRRPQRTGEYSRAYSPGDSPAQIDWKVFARADALLVRQSRDEASAQVRIVIDTGPTLLWPDAATLAQLPQAVPTKLELALRLALNLAYIHLKLGDKVRVVLSQDDLSQAQRSLRTTTTAETLRSFDLLAAGQFSASALWAEAHEFAAGGSDCDLGYLLSDALGTTTFDPHQAGAKYFKLIHILSSLELSADWLRPEYCYYDEGGSTHEYLGAILRRDGAYQSQLRRWQDSLQQRLRAKGHGYQLVTDRTLIRTFHDELLDL